MFKNNINDDYKLDFSSSKFRIAFDFIKRNDLNDLPLGWFDLPEGVRVGVQEYETLDPSGLMYETHNKYIDLQLSLKGEEYIGVAPRKELTSKIPYNPDSDIEFYDSPEKEDYILLREGYYVIFPTEDAHKPRCLVKNPEIIKKIVIKIPV